MDGAEKELGQRLGTSRSRSGFSGKPFLPTTHAKCKAGFARFKEALREQALSQKYNTFAASYLAGGAEAFKRFTRLQGFAFAQWGSGTAQGRPAAIPLFILIVPARDVPMQQWSLTLHGPGGILSTLDSGETQFVLGTEQGADVWTIAGAGVAPRHALVRVAAGQIQVEDLAGGTLVNGHLITGRVETEYPASVQVGDVTLVVEQKGGDFSQAATIVQSPRQAGAPLDELEATVVTPRAAQQPAAGQRTVELNEAEAFCKYTLMKEIARGGMGQIYFGEDSRVGSIDDHLPKQRERLGAQPMLAKQLLNQKI